MCSLTVMNALTHFSNVTLSSIYFDINKDCLYADGLCTPKRRTVIAVLKQVMLYPIMGLFRS